MPGLTNPLLRRLALCALALACACQRAKLQQVLPPGARVDVLPQVSRAQLDALFIVDNADQITPHQQKVASSFGRFLGYLDKNQIDYHIGLVSTDVTAGHAGQYVGGGSKSYFASGDSNLAADLPAAVLSLGEKGSAVEATLQQADLSLRQPPLGFLRDGASLFLVAVTDDDDSWSAPAPDADPAIGDLYYYRAFKQAKGAGNDGLVTFSAIAGDVPGHCANPSPGCGCSISDPQNPQNTFIATSAVRLQALTAKMGGVFHSLCDPSFDAVFDQLGATAAGLKHNFRLAQVPDLRTLVVTVLAPCDARPDALASCAQQMSLCQDQSPAIACTPHQTAPGVDGWSYDAGTNSIVFTGAAIPPRGSLVEAQYQEAGKP